MKKLQILGTGCSKCKTLTKQTEKAAKSIGLEYVLEKVTDIEKIVAFGVMATPALAVDGVVKVSGRLPSLEEIKTMIGS
jgi:small redox-active disulfide protein 2